MRTREIERKIKKVLNHNNFILRVRREDMIIQIKFSPALGSEHNIYSSLDKYVTLDQLNGLSKQFNTNDVTIFPEDGYFYVNIYYND